MLSKLKQSPLAWTLRRTAVYRIWRHFRDPASARSSRHEIAFYRRLLEPLDVVTVLDIGANVGSKTEIFRTMANRVVAVEPDPDLAARLRVRFDRDSRVLVEQAAVAAVAGTIDLFKFEGKSAFNTASREWADYLVAPNSRPGAPACAPVAMPVSTVTLASLVERYGPVQFLKVDVEGLEWNVLSTLATPIACISLEFNLPTFWPQLVRSVEYLQHLNPSYVFNAVVTEPPERFELQSWLGGADFLADLERRNLNYAEVYARDASHGSRG